MKAQLLDILRFIFILVAGGFAVLILGRGISLIAGILRHKK